MPSAVACVDSPARAGIGRPGAFLCRRFTPGVEAALRERFALTTNEDDSILAPSEIAERARDAEVLFVTATESLRADTLAQLPRLRIIATLSVGHDHIDLAAARAAGIAVFHTPDVLSDACAEIAMMLLLNACLTVRAGQAGSHHGKGWEQFTDAVIRELNDHREGIVFMLWGSYAQKKGQFIDRKKHCVLQAPHPSPLSAHRGFLGCGHFSKANDYLKQRGGQPIDWALPNL